VLVQGWGPPPRELADPLRAAGAEVVELSPYASGWPRDPRPAQELARAAAAGRLEAISFTSATAVRQLAVLAEAAGVPTAEIAAGGALIAAVGPVTREAVLAEGLPVHVEPEPPRMGALYRAIAAAIAASSAPDIRLRRRAEGDAPAEAAAAASPG
jgi:uroporphyrinogen-III synthase